MKKKHCPVCAEPVLVVPKHCIGVLVSQTEFCGFCGYIYKVSFEGANVTEKIGAVILNRNASMDDRDFEVVQWRYERRTQALQEAKTLIEEPWGRHFLQAWRRTRHVDRNALLRAFLNELQPRQDEFPLTLEALLWKVKEISK